jgi:hypothetical protein
MVKLSILSQGINPLFLIPLAFFIGIIIYALFTNLFLKEEKRRQYTNDSLKGIIIAIIIGFILLAIFF